MRKGMPTRAGAMLRSGGGIICSRECELVQGPPLPGQGKENAGDERASFIVEASDEAFSPARPT